MKILIDISELVHWDKPHFTGIQRVIYNIAKSSQRLNDVAFIYFKTSTETFIYKENLHSKAVETDLNTVKFQSQTVLLLGATWNTPQIIEKLKSIKAETNIKLAHFIHDISPIKVPHFHKEHFLEVNKTWLAQIKKIIDIYIFNSNFTKKEFISYFPDLDKLENLVLPLASYLEQCKSQEIPLIKVPFILSVGTIEPRKNHFILYQVWKLLKSENQTIPHLVIAGSKGWNSETIFNLLKKDPALKNYITIIEGCSDSELKSLYENCAFTVFPSHYEGWGLPVTESLSMYKICICSNQASMPEAGEDLVEYFDPLNSNELKELTLKYWYSIELRKEKEDKIKSNFIHLTWIEQAKKLHSYLNSFK